MFFNERIKSIKPGDRVLEVGPGGAPHPRSDVLLEYEFTEAEASAQRGHTEDLSTHQKVVYYSGDRFPFDDQCFDYVICSHVLEHVEADGLPAFVSELQRVAGKGYVEFPTIYYEYLYNFDVHKTLLSYIDGVVVYISKSETRLDEFLPVQNMFYRSLELGYEELVRNNRDVFSHGFEWSRSIEIRAVDSIRDLAIDPATLARPASPYRLKAVLSHLKGRLRGLFGGGR